MGEELKPGQEHADWKAEETNTGTKIKPLLMETQAGVNLKDLGINTENTSNPQTVSHVEDNPADEFDDEASDLTSAVNTVDDRIMPEQLPRNLDGQIVSPQTNEPVRPGSPEWRELAERNQLPLNQ